MSNENDMEIMALKGRKFVEKHFSWHTHNKKLAAIITENNWPSGLAHQSTSSEPRNFLLIN